MPALDRAIGFDDVRAIHRAIIGSLTPEEMAMSMALMMTAMNIEHRAEVLGGMQQGAPTAAKRLGIA
jgi:hypothetical protein